MQNSKLEPEAWKSIRILYLYLELKSWILPFESTTKVENEK